MTSDSYWQQRPYQVIKVLDGTGANQPFFQPTGRPSITLFAQIGYYVGQIEWQLQSSGICHDIRHRIVESNGYRVLDTATTPAPVCDCVAEAEVTLDRREIFHRVE